MAINFFRCETCGNIVVKFHDSGVVPHCCGEKMTLLTPNTTETMTEKHLPVVECKEGKVLTVKVGAEPHPMQDDHYIQFIVLETMNGMQVRHLKPGSKPKARFDISNDIPIAVYEYCNRHGLWRG